MINFLKRLFLSTEGKASLTKIGNKVLAACGLAVTLQITGAIHMPVWGFVACIVVGFFGGTITIDGLRDAITKKNT